MHHGLSFYFHKLHLYVGYRLKSTRLISCTLTQYFQIVRSRTDLITENVLSHKRRSHKIFFATFRSYFFYLLRLIYFFLLRILAPRLFRLPPPLNNNFSLALIGNHHFSFTQFFISNIQTYSFNSLVTYKKKSFITNLFRVSTSKCIERAIL